MKSKQHPLEHVFRQLGAAHDDQLAAEMLKQIIGNNGGQSPSDTDLASMRASLDRLKVIFGAALERVDDVLAQSKKLEAQSTGGGFTAWFIECPDHPNLLVSVTNVDGQAPKHPERELLAFEVQDRNTGEDYKCYADIKGRAGMLDWLKQHSISFPDNGAEMEIESLVRQVAHAIAAHHAS